MVWSVLRLNLYHPITLCRQKKIHRYCWITVCDCHTEASLVQCKVMSELFANKYVFKHLINLKPLKLLSLIPIFFPSKPCVELACFWACVQAEIANFLVLLFVSFQLLLSPCKTLFCGKDKVFLMKWSLTTCELTSADLKGEIGGTPLGYLKCSLEKLTIKNKVVTHM